LGAGRAATAQEDSAEDLYAMSISLDDINWTTIDFQAVFEIHKSLKKQELLNRVVEVCLDSSG